jgi:hypothetical protein
MFKSATIATTLLLTMVWADSAFAWSFWDCLPIIPPPPPQQVPEIDASSGVAAIALIMSVGAIIHRKLRGE